jgi:hypothetical protein
MAEGPCDYARWMAGVNAKRQVSSQDSQDDSQAESFPGPDEVRTLFSGIGSFEKGETAMLEVAGAAGLSGREQR